MRRYRREILVCALLTAITAAVFAQTLGHQFINFDDGPYVYDNPMVKAGLTKAGMTWAWTTFYFLNWHPLTWLSYMLDTQLFGLNPGWMHGVNVLLHLANTILVFWVFARMTGEFGRPAMMAAFFAIHPLHVESVAWIAERKDVLSGFFWMLTLWAYWFYSESPSWKRYFWVVVSLALGLMAKPMLVTMPGVLLLLDYWPLRRFERLTSDGLTTQTVVQRLVLEKVPLLVLVLGAGILTIKAQSYGGNIHSLSSIPFPLRLANVVMAYLGYLGKTFWPQHLAIFYPYRTSMPPWWEIVGALLVLVGVTILVLRFIKSCPYLLVGWLWYLGTLVPVIGLVQAGDQAMADRYMYMPILGLFLMVVWGVADLTSRHRALRLGGVAVAGSLLLICAVGAWIQTGYWRDSLTVFSHAVEVTSDNSTAHLNLGCALAAQGRLAEAMVHWQEALRIRPDYADAHLNYGAGLFQQGKVNDAIAHLAEAININPGSAQAYYNLGEVLQQVGRGREAVACYQQAVKLEPNRADIHSNLGVALAEQGKRDEAMVQFREAVRLDPNYALAYNNLGFTFEQEGNLEQAILNYAQAVQHEPNSAPFHFNLGNVLEQKGKLEEALAHFSVTAQLNPQYPEIQHRIASLRSRLEKGT